MKILSFGEILWDVFPDGAFIGGAPLNLAAHTALQGADSRVVSAVGDDDYKEKTLNEVKALGVKTDYISILTSKITGKCLVSFDENHVPSYNLLDDVAYDYIQVPEISSDARFDILAFGTLALRHENNIATLKELIGMEVCENIYSDLNIRPPFYSDESIRFCVENANIVKISDEELPTVLDALNIENTDIEGAVKSLTKKYSQLKIIIITCGENGAYCYDVKNCKMHYTPAEKTKFISAVGAGDSFGATFLVEYFKGKSIPECLALAAKVSAFVVSCNGAVPQYDINKL